MFNLDSYSYNLAQKTFYKNNENVLYIDFGKYGINLLKLVAIGCIIVNIVKSGKGEYLRLVVLI